MESRCKLANFANQRLPHLTVTALVGVWFLLVVSHGNASDRQGDAAVNRRTLAVLLSDKAFRVFLAALFVASVGLIVARTGAPVMPVIIEGTPILDGGGGAWTSLWKRGRARVTFGPLLQLEKQTATEAAEKLHDWFVEATGWPTAPTPQGPAFRG